MVIDRVPPSIQGAKFMSWRLFGLKRTSWPKRRDDSPLSVSELASENPGNLATINCVNVPAIVADEDCLGTQIPEDTGSSERFVKIITISCDRGRYDLSEKSLF
jgi:hypothetical protein